MTQQEVRANYIIEIATPTPRRLTSYRGLTSDGRRGLIVGGHYYKAAIVEFPGIEETDDVAPVRVVVSIGDADRTSPNTDLYSNTANIKAPITITKVIFTGATWSESLAPSFTLETWFEGQIGKPAIRGQRVVLDCRSYVGRRGTVPRKKSRELMVNAQPIAQGQKLNILSRFAS